MKATQKKHDGLSYEYEVKIPAKDLDAKVDAKLQSYSGQIRMPGFRPGKVPMKLLKQKHGSAVLGEVIEEAVQEATQKVIEEIKESSLAQEAQLIRQWETTNLQNKLTLDMASKDDIEREYGQQQQGQEVAFSRWSQLYQEKSKDQLIELNLEPSKKGGVASEETSDESKG